MASLRIVVLARRFWPIVDETESLLTSLAVELVRRDVQVTILTTRAQPEWPERIVCQGLPVVRLRRPPRPCAVLRYRRAICRWLVDQADDFDLLYVSGLRHEAAAAMAAANQTGLPVVLRAERAGLWGDCCWQLEAPGGAAIKRRCFQADVLIAPSRAIERELIAAGYPRNRIRYVPNGVEPRLPRTAQDRLAAREALAEEHLWLEMQPQAPLVVAIGPLEETQGYEHLLRGWPNVVARWPNARLWIVGQGSRRGALLTQIEAAGMSSWVALPGAFDHLDDLLAAADLFVHPVLEDGMSPALLNAMSAGLPIVATDIPANQELISSHQHGLLVPAEDASALAEAMSQVLEDPALAIDLGQAAAGRVQQEFSLSRMVDSHLELFASLAESRSSTT